MTARRAWTAARPLAALLLPLAVALPGAACGGGGEAGDADAPGGPQASESYPEGKVTVKAELLDTGLLKGTATAEARGGRRISSLSVTATAPGGQNWGVLQFPSGIGSAAASDFFEVQLQELPRGEQLQITATVTFESEAGEKVQRQAIDRWPP